MAGHDKAVSRFRSRIAAVLVLRQCLMLFCVWSMIWGAAVIVLRVGLRVDQQAMLWGLLGFLPAAAVAVVLARRRTPSPQAVRAVLDRNGMLGGLLMADGDRDIGAWSERITALPSPELRWQARRQWTLFLSALAFLAATFLMPNRYLPATEGESLQIGAEMQRLTEKLQLLTQEKIVPPEKAQALEKNLQRAREEASGKNPAKTLEALDHLEQSLIKSAEEAAQSALKQAEKATKAQEMAQTLDKDQGQMDPKSLSEAMKQLAQMADQAASEAELPDGVFPADLKGACQKGDLSPAQLKELQKALSKCKACDREKLEKMAKAKLIDPAQLERCDGAGEGPNGELAQLLEGQNVVEDPEGELALLLAGEGAVEDPEGESALLLAGAGSLSGASGSGPSADGDGLPGNGGINRGRGDAAITWTKENASKQNAGFKEQVLPPASLSALKDSRLAGVSLGDPTSQKKGPGASSGGALDSAAAGGAANAQVILPEHEKAVSRYFERDKK